MKKNRNILKHKWSLALALILTAALTAMGTLPALALETWGVTLDPSWQYAGNSKIHTGTAVVYYTDVTPKKGLTVCINAGHGTKGGASVKTLCHPDGSPKVTSGSTAAGATTATAIAYGTTMLDGTLEATVTLRAAIATKNVLLARGYDVLMIRESSDVQLDNVARTVIANNIADCHISLHYDSTTSDKGAFYCSVPNVASYRAMEPVASHWRDHNYLGDCLIGGLQSAGVKIRSNSAVPTDLTQTSYSTVPSVDLEVGDRASDYSDASLNKIAQGIANGLDNFSKAFLDVPTNAYYYQPVQWAVQQKITGGYSAIRFAPDGSCNRAQMVTFLWRAAGSPAAAVSSNPFTDVASNAYYYQAVLWAVQKGITTWTSDTTFSPDDIVDRGQVATFLWRAAGSEAVIGTPNPFTDVTSEDYFNQAVLWAVSKKITQGTSETTFSPADPCTRAQAVTFLYRSR